MSQLTNEKQKKKGIGEFGALGGVNGDARLSPQRVLDVGGRVIYAEGLGIYAINNSFVFF
jgi:hypothetical protein